MEQQNAPYSMALNPEGQNFTFSGKLHFGNFNRSSAMVNKSKGYYPIVVTAMCKYPEDASKFYHCLYFFDLSTSTAQSRL